MHGSAICEVGSPTLTKNPRGNFKSKRALSVNAKTPQVYCKDSYF